MAVLLPNSVFFHVGRTGGHWVTNVLRQAGLLQKHLQPMHMTPVQARSRKLVAHDPFSFCFVRHPLTWLASLWCHEMEYGWHQSELATHAEAEIFADFLERLLARWPDGFCTEHFSAYTSHCGFVGRTEAIAADLGRALSLAGEAFDPACLDVEAFNATGIDRLKRAARAPRSLLAEILRKEAAVTDRFDYDYVPEDLVWEETVKPVWPRLSIKPDADLDTWLRDNELGVTSVSFDYRFTNGARIDARTNDRRAQWGFIEALRSLPPQDTCLVVGESDPYFAYLLAEVGWRDVSFAGANRHLMPRRLRAMMEKDVRERTYAEVVTDPVGEGVDLVVLVDALENNPLFELDLLNAARMIKPDGSIVFAAPVLDLPDGSAFKTLWPLGLETTFGKKLSYASVAYLEDFLKTLGFGDVQILDRFFESPNEKLRPASDRLATACRADPGTFLGKAILRAQRNGSEDADERSRSLVALWLSRSPRDLVDLPIDALPTLAKATIATLRREIEDERRRADLAEQGLADRDADLATVRATLAATGIDADFHRQALIESRANAAAAHKKYQDLLLRLGEEATSVA